MPEPTDALTVTFRPPRGPRQRLRFEPRSDDTHWRIDEVWTGCMWRERGREPVDDVTIERGAERLP